MSILSDAWNSKKYGSNDPAHWRDKSAAERRSEDAAFKAKQKADAEARHNSGTLYS